MVPTTKAKLLLALQSRQPGWCFKTVDWEKCVYRNIGEYGIEISGATRRPPRFQIFVWKKDPVYRIVERHTDIDPRKEDVVGLACSVAKRYAGIALEEGTYKPSDDLPEEEQDLPF